MVLQIFCTQGPLWVKSEEGNNLVKKWSQNFKLIRSATLFTQHAKCRLHIMILAQAVIKIFCS